MVSRDKKKTEESLKWVKSLKDHKRPKIRMKTEV